MSDVNGQYRMSIFEAPTSRFEICLYNREHIMKYVKYLGIMAGEKYLGVRGIEDI